MINYQDIIALRNFNFHFSPLLNFLLAYVLSIKWQVFRHSKKFCPEAIMFLQTSLLSTTESKHISEEDSQVWFFPLIIWSLSHIMWWVHVCMSLLYMRTIYLIT